MREAIEPHIIADKIVEAFTLMGKVVGYSVAQRIFESIPGASSQLTEGSHPLMLDLKEAAAYLGVGKSTLHKWATAGRVPRVMADGRPKYRRYDLEQFVASLNKLGEPPKLKRGRLPKMPSL